MTVAHERIHGLNGSAQAWYAAKLSSDSPRLVVICRDRNSALAFASDLRFYLPERRLVEFPGWDTLPFEAVPPQTFLSAERLRTLLTLTTTEPLSVVTSVEAICQRVLPRDLLSALSLEIHVGQEIDRDRFLGQLDACGFRRVSLVEEVGEFALRGGVIDLFPSTTTDPIRLELLHTVVDRIKTFDLNSQRSIGSHEQVLILPVRECIRFSALQNTQSLLAPALARIKERGREVEAPPREIAMVLNALRTDRDHPALELLQAIALKPLTTFFDYLDVDHSLIVLDDEIEVTQALDQFLAVVEEREARLLADQHLIPEKGDLYLSVDEVLTRIGQRRTISFDHFALQDSRELSPVPTQHLHTFGNSELSERLKAARATLTPLKPLYDFAHRFRKDGFRIAFVVGSTARSKRLKRLLLDVGLDAKLCPELGGDRWSTVADRYPLVILPGHLTHGVQLLKEKLIYVSESELFGERSYRRSKTTHRSLKRIMGSLAQLQEGNFVVHMDYGIGIYLGLKHLEIDGQGSDLVQIEYADSTLYLPVQNVGKIQKFSGPEGQNPNLDRLSSSRWKKTKQRVKQAVVSLAGELIKLYAARSVAEGWRFDPYGAEDERFADGFPYNETPDQLKAIEETLQDMAQVKPMDRLVCGDVGFGKTEVALRATYKCIQHARQVALLAPTTILVEQHKETFLTRFTEYPVQIGCMSRFYSAQQNRETLERLASGELDIIIGTHRLLQKDIQFRDLGLLIIDEEHRFGVKQKEKLKQLKRQVDVLTLTATPIPRTLHMSLLDIRDISIISTPPHDRRSIRTYIAPREESLIRDAILREIQRGGQCFYVHNRVLGIELITAELVDLVPEARFAFGHGQMPESELEKIMLRFLQREVDVLVCTTIIESGLDIPNTNTIFINRSDAFGLAQLYQLRGRVGRSARQAYCYLFVPHKAKLSREAQQRLKALQSLDDLGRGFDLAMRDLEIRGAGNLLGKEQSGNVLAVGFDLYSRILKEAVHHLRGDELSMEEIIEPEVRIEANAFIPDYYIPDLSERLILYQRLASLRSSDEAQELTLEIEDRFGGLGDEMLNLVSLMNFRSVLRRFGIVRADCGKAKVVLSFAPNAPIDGAKLAHLVQTKRERFKLGKGTILRILLKPEENEPDNIYRVVREVLEEVGKL